MAKSEVEELTEATVATGGILAKLYFDMQSENEDDLQPLMADLINNKLLKASGVVYCYGSIDEPIKSGDAYVTNAAVVILVKDFSALINVAFNFAPAGVEILRPEKEYMLRQGELQSIILDIAQISVDYSRYILSRVMSKSDYDKIINDIRNREELGRKLVKKDGKDDVRQ